MLLPTADVGLKSAFYGVVLWASYISHPYGPYSKKTIFLFTSRTIGAAVNYTKHRHLDFFTRQFYGHWQTSLPAIHLNLARSRCSAVTSRETKLLEDLRYFHFHFCHFSIFASYLNKLLPGELSLGLQIFVLCSGDGTWEKLCYLRLYVKGRGCGVQSKSSIFNNVVFFAVVFEQTPPTGFVCWASKFFSKLTRCNLRKVVLFVTLHQRAWPWCCVKVGHF